MIRNFFCIVIALLSLSCYAATISGELKKWHKVTLLFNGPWSSEGDATNPFTDYRLVVTFTNGTKSYVVYGHYAADGNAANSSADNGNKWRAYFCPDETGIWNYSVSFRTGPNINLDDNLTSGTPVAPLDGETGSFFIAPTDKTGNDFRGKGRLAYVNMHHLQFQETGEYFLKGGADSPENFLAYFEFDSTEDKSTPAHPASLSSSNGLHTYSPHVADWKSGDPVWKTNKGKGIIGALNYLASKGVNSIYFITYNLDGGDGKDTWMWTTSNERWRYDVSKLDQWEIVFSHMDSLGIQMHVLTQETENDGNLGGNGNLNNVRKLYYKELISRYAHHLGLIWNLGEENTNTDAQRASFAQYFHEHDPYDNPVTVHNWNNTALTFYDGILGNPSYLQYFEMTSLQGDGSQYNYWAIQLRNDSEAAGRKWVICGDEQTPDVSYSLSNIESLRKNALWGNLMGGGGGVEWYFGYQDAQNFGDLQSEDFRMAETLWEQTKYALDFFHDNLPFHEMEPDNSLFTATNGWNNPGGYCLYKAGEVYAIYVKPGFNNITVSVTLDAGDYTVKWFNPRTGGALINGSVTNVTGGGTVSLGTNPVNDSNDWVVLVKKTGLSPTITTWTGNLNSNWLAASNWTNGIPDLTTEVVIPNVFPKSFPQIISGAVEVTNLSIYAGASLTIADNAELIIHGNLNASGQLLGTGKLTFNGPSHILTNQLIFNGVLQVKSGSNLITNGNLILADGASLLHGTGTTNGGGTVTGAIKMRRNGNSNPMAYSYWSSPVEGANVLLLGNNLHYYDANSATDNTIVGLKAGWQAATGTMADALGYIGRGNSMIEFNGTPHDGNYSIAVTKNPVTSVPWNLIGNPYPSAIDAAAFMAVNGPAGSNPVITGSLYFWDDDNSNGSGYAMQDYAVWSGAGAITGPNTGTTFQGHIASCQAFFVEKITAGNGNVLFTNAMRSSVNNAFFRQAPMQRFWISAVSPSGDYNETLVAFISDASDSADLLYDSKKLKGNNRIALYTKIQNEAYAIQALPEMTHDRQIIMGMDAGTSGTYTISLKTIENIDETICIYLEDTGTGHIQNLRLTPHYSFTTAAGIFDGRFLLHVTTPLRVDVIEATCAGNDAELSLEQSGSKTWNYTLTDANGNTVEHVVNFNGRRTIGNLRKGIYTLTLQDSTGYRVIKTIDVNGAVQVSADYSVSETLVFAGEIIHFANLSTGAVRFAWNFGDGETSYDEHPAHAYSNEGVYDVTLLAENDECSAMKSATIQVLKNEPTTASPASLEVARIYNINSTVLIDFANTRYGDATVDIFNSLGETIVCKNSSAERLEIKLPEPVAGHYFVRVLTKDGLVTQKILIAR